MKFRIALACLAAALLLSCEPYNRSNSGVSATEKTLLFDFRDQKPPDKPNVDAVRQRAVLTAVAPRYYTAVTDCPQSGDGVVLRIDAVAEGSFTAPAARETAYLVDYLRCSENPDDRRNRLIVFAGDKPVATAELPEFEVLKTYDLDRDGRNELLLARGYARQGETGTLARLVQFDHGKLAVVEDFGSVYDDNCGRFVNLSAGGRQDLHAVGVDPLMNAVVLWYLPRPQQMPSFTAQRFRAPCPAQGQSPHWAAISR